jgi:copper transport protein
MKARRPAFLRLLAAAVLLVAAGAAFPAAAVAHAALESSDPAAGAELASSPARIVLTFGETPDPKLSLIRLVDSAGALVPGVSPVQSVPGNALQLEVTLSRQLPKGVYSVNWLGVSATDGHVDGGAFAFGVQEKPAPSSAVVVPLSHQSATTDVAGAVGRWLLYAALILMVGAASTSLFVFGGKLPVGGVVVLRTAAFVGVVGLFVMVWIEKILVGAPSLMPLFLTKEGQQLLALGVALLFCIGAVVAVDLWPARWSLWLVGVAGSATMLVHVIAGHAASGSSLWLLNIAVQWVHLTSVGVWVGGLFWLLLGLRGSGPVARGAAVGRFVTIATAMLVVVLVTGLARAMVEIGSLGALVDTGYGITLLVKIALVAALVVLGALNHFSWAPAVTRGEAGPAARRFILDSRGELVVGLCILAATAVLSGLAPPPPKPASTSAAGALPAAALLAVAPQGVAPQTDVPVPPLSSITTAPSRP